MTLKWVQYVIIINTILWMSTTQLIHRLRYVDGCKCVKSASMLVHLQNIQDELKYLLLYQTCGGLVFNKHCKHFGIYVVYNFHGGEQDRSGYTADPCLRLQLRLTVDLGVFFGGRGSQWLSFFLHFCVASELYTLMW